MNMKHLIWIIGMAAMMVACQTNTTTMISETTIQQAPEKRKRVFVVV
jgi:hypothetical protein